LFKTPIEWQLIGIRSKTIVNYHWKRYWRIITFRLTINYSWTCFMCLKSNLHNNIIHCYKIQTPSNNQFLLHYSIACVALHTSSQESSRLIASGIAPQSTHITVHCKNVWITFLPSTIVLCLIQTPCCPYFQH